MSYQMKTFGDYGLHYFTNSMTLPITKYKFGFMQSFHSVYEALGYAIG